MKNILIFNDAFFPISETFIHRQIQGLSRKNNITLLAYSYLNDDKFYCPYKKIQIVRYKNFFDKIVSYGYKKFTGTSYHLSLFTKNLVRDLILESEIDIIHAHFGSSAIEILPIARLLKIPLVVSFHGIDASPAYTKNKQYRKQLNSLFEYSKAIIIVSPHMIDTLGLTNWKDKVHLIPYGVDSDFFDSSGKSLVRNTDTIKILHSGRLVQKKGVPDLVKVFLDLCDKYDNISLEIIGDGPDKEDCERNIKESRFKERILMRGSQSQEVVKKAMNNCDIFVLNSRTDNAGDMEGLPNTILEAMSMQIPVVSTYHAGIPQVITNGVNGLLVTERDNNELYNAIEKLIMDEALRTSLSMTARETIKADFCIENMQTNILNVFD